MHYTTKNYVLKPIYNDENECINDTLSVGYLRKTLNCPKTLYDLIHMMSMVDHVAIDVITLRIDSGCSLEKEFTELIHMNP